MSPAPRKPRAKKPKALKAKKNYDETLPAEGGTVGVRTNGDSVVVRWTCGGTRTFTPADLRASIDYLEMVCVHGDVWLTHKDTQASMFSAVVIDGEFYANDNISDNSSHLPWDAFKAKLEGAIA